MNAAAGKEVQKQDMDEERFIASRTLPEHHVYRKNGVHRHVDEHESGDTVALIQQHYERHDV